MFVHLVSLICPLILTVPVFRNNARVWMYVFLRAMRFQFSWKLEIFSRIPAFAHYAMMLFSVQSIYGITAFLMLFLIFITYLEHFTSKIQARRIFIDLVIYPYSLLRHLLEPMQLLIKTCLLRIVLYWTEVQGQ